MKLATKIEAILYIKGRPLSIEEIGALLEYETDCDRAAPRLGRDRTLDNFTDRDMIQEGLIELMNDYAHRDSALEIVETNLGYSLQLKSSYNSLLKDLIPAELGKGALRTLAAIALKNPILQTDLIELRGSSAYQQVSELVELGFIRKKPQTDGRSYWLEVTDKFHQYFEIQQMLAS
ncbi:MAG: SMC-Scp complex subunit ScpB [Xenococcaceae cyanobacterium MO_188.B19]|nr:SMC-Scp complex subunit ScpB [Xenococcaceae cyanobacterium MO_188.B19]